MLLTYPLMVAIQEISARLGRTTGHGIAGNLFGTIRTGCCKSS
jgi:Mn2+/Fe2+ NRAMP family transporter